MRGAPDICLVEVGGTVGDIESMVFLEALRQFQFRVKRENISFVHVSLVPSLSSVGEQKTKPTQHGVKQLMMAGEDLLFHSPYRFVIIHCCFVWTDVLIFFNFFCYNFFLFVYFFYFFYFLYFLFFLGEQDFNLIF